MTPTKVSIDNSKRLVARTTDRLQGKTAKEEREEWNIRQSVWYGRWNLIAKELTTFPKPTEKEILLIIHRAIDGVNGYHYNRISESSRRAIDLVAKDNNL